MTLSGSHHVVENKTDNGMSQHVIDSKGDSSEQRTKTQRYDGRVCLALDLNVCECCRHRPWPSSPDVETPVSCFKKIVAKRKQSYPSADGQSRQRRETTKEFLAFWSLRLGAIDGVAVDLKLKYNRA